MAGVAAVILAPAPANAVTLASHAVGETATGVVLLHSEGGSATVAFLAQEAVPGVLRLVVRWCTAPSACRVIREEAGGTLVTEERWVRLTATSSAFGHISLRARRGREDVGNGSCIFEWTDSETRDTGRIAFDRYGHSVKAPWAGSFGGGRASAFPGNACDWYQDAGVMVMHG